MSVDVKTANAAGSQEANAGGADEVENTETNQAAAPEANASARLLEESKKFKTRALQAERELEKIRKAQAEESGRYKELYEKVESEKKELLGNMIKERVKSSVTEIAARAGCLDIDALLQLGPRDLLAYDEEQHRVDGVEAFVEQGKKLKPYLFNSAKPAAVNPATPSAAPVKTTTLADISKLPADQKYKIWAEAMNKKATKVMGQD